VEAHGAGVSVRNWTDDQGECTSYESIMRDARRFVCLSLSLSLARARARRAIPLPGVVVVIFARRPLTVHARVACRHSTFPRREIRRR